MKSMQSARTASYPCRIERGTPDATISFRDVPRAMAAGRGVPGVFEAAESVLVAALAARSGGGLPAASVPAPGEVLVTVRLGGPPLVRTTPPAAPPPPEPDAGDEDAPAVSGEVIDVPSETGLVATRRRGFWGWLAGLFGGSRS